MAYDAGNTWSCRGRIVSRSAWVAGRTRRRARARCRRSAASTEWTWLTSLGGAPVRAELRHPDVGDVGGQLPVVDPLGQLLEHGVQQGRAQRRQASSSPTTQGPRIHARPRSASQSPITPPTMLPSSRATRTLAVQSGSTSPSSAAMPSRVLAEHGRATVGVGLLGGDQVEHLVQLVGGDGDHGHKSSSFSRSAAGRLPGSARSAAIRQVTSRSRSLTGVGMPCRRPSREISPLR